ncbi:MAG TPA: elongation factor P maturation arginine rhamnosyltransferase EarP [Albitalea sp.]|nr:elongation factor P maturation arginine rhamnosyltransferase EarP [Albitalea sp.]
MLWDVFCHVVDNYGDIGVCWRLAADLAARGERVRLWVDDAGALAWMAPDGHPGVQVLGWHQADTALHPGDVVIEAFGCNPPAGFVARMARAPRPAVWINLEYLSAEPYVERSHGLPSPQMSGPAAGLTKWFFYPGFTPRTGGLLREPGLIERLASASGDQWLAEQGIGRKAGERVVSLFCYANRRLPALIDALSDTPTLLLATAGAAASQMSAALGPSLARRALRAVVLPFMPQTEYDRLLAASDVNFVRGEDSFVRAQWAAKPFVWQIYAQDDGAHAAKLDAFLDLYLAGADPTLSRQVRSLWAAWNGLSPGLPPWQEPVAPGSAWQLQAERWRDGLLVQPDLVTQLIGFVMERR